MENVLDPITMREVEKVVATEPDIHRTVNFHVKAPALVVFQNEEVFGIKVALLKVGDNLFTSYKGKTHYRVLDLSGVLAKWPYEGGDTIPPGKGI